MKNVELAPESVVLTIASTKLSPGPQSSYTIPRMDLYRRLATGLQRRATVVTAAAGYGKTTLLASYLSSIRCPAIWYRLHEDDADPLRFLLHLSEGCRQIIPQLAQFDFGLASSGQLRRDPHIVLAPLMAQLSELNQGQVVVVLDDFHAVSGSADVVRILDYVLKYLPADFHIFITTRSDATTPELARLRQYGEVLDLSEADLGFTADETSSLLHRWGILDLSEADVQRIVDRTSGWAAALQMICQQLSRRLDSVDQLLSVELSGSRQPMYDYLALHVLCAQPLAIQQFMEKTSFLFQVTPSAVSGLLGIPNAGEILDDLCRSHALISYLGLQAGQPVYHYHSLFQDFLQARLLRREGASAVRELHLACGQFFESEESWEAAFHHYCKGEHWDAASRIARLRAMWLIRGGELSRIWDWLSRIPSGVLENDPWLLLYRGRILRLEDKLQPALTSIQRAERLFRPRKDRLGIARTVLERAWIIWELGEVAEGLRLLEEVLQITPRGDHYLRAEINSYLIAAYAACGRFREAADCFEKALSLLERVHEHRSSLVLRARTMRRQAWAELQQGRVGAALHLAAQACDLCNIETLDERTSAHCIHALALVHSTRGDFDRAMSLLDQAGEIANRRGLTELLNKVTGARADILATSHDLSQAENLHSASGGRTSDIGGLAYVWLRQGRIDEARQSCLKDMEDAQSRGAPIDLARARALLGIVESEAGNGSAARQHLSQAAGMFERLGAEYNLAGVRLHLARVLYESGQSTAGREALAAALQFAQREQCTNFLLWMPDTVAYLAAQALRENLSREYVVKLCTRRLSAAQLSFFLPLLSQDDPPLRELATRLILDLAGPGAQDGTAIEPLLVACKDEDVRAHIVNAVADHRLTVAGILRLHHTYGLTWREIEIFVRYYLPVRHGGAPDDQIDSHRANLAQSLCITDNTLRFHISAIRRKLGLLGSTRGISVYQWALDEGILGRAVESSVRA